MKPEGRNIKRFDQIPRLGNLPNRLVVISSCMLACSLIFPAFMVIMMMNVSCEPNQIQVRFPESDSADAADSIEVRDTTEILTKLELEVGGKTGEGKELGEIADALDVFYYGGEDVKVLENHFRISVKELEIMDGKECLLVRSSSNRPGTVVVVANCSRSYNLKALAKLESIELLEYEYLDENPKRPVMSGKATISPGRDTVLEITPLLCEVVLKSVSNGLDDYELLEEPSVRLCDINPSARLLQFKDFHPSETISGGELHKLPTDVGFYTKRPDISLYCYPNDTDKQTLGIPRTNIEFNCKIKGEEYSFPFDLPPMGRGERIGVDIIINGFEFQQQNVIFTD